MMKLIAKKEATRLLCCADGKEAAGQLAAQHSFRAGVGEQQRQGPAEEG